MYREAQEILAIARELISEHKTIRRVAAEKIPRVVGTYYRKADTEVSVLNSITSEIQRFVATIRDNEKIECFVLREDDNDKMIITVGMSEHEGMDGIVKKLKELMDKKGAKAGLKTKAEILKN